MKNTLTKVLTIVAVALVALIAATAITLSIVKTDFNQVIDTEKVDSITVYLQDKDNCYTAENGADEFNKMKELYNVGTKETILSTLFQGAFSEEAKAEVIPTSQSISSLKTPAEGTVVLKITFSEQQKLVVNDETITDSSIYGTDKSVYYDTVYLNVEDHDTLTKVRCYIVSSSASTYCYRYVSFSAHHSELYDYVSGLDFPG
ncbi:MAG: hypothetical protein IKB42_02420 [Clostridia bacterium]|nr:hypothetical protein [Clostridia bacterium]